MKRDDHLQTGIMIVVLSVENLRWRLTIRVRGSSSSIVVYISRTLKGGRRWAELSLRNSTSTYRSHDKLMCGYRIESWELPWSHCNGKYLVSKWTRGIIRDIRIVLQSSWAFPVSHRMHQVDEIWRVGLLNCPNFFDILMRSDRVQTFIRKDAIKTEFASGWYPPRAWCLLVRLSSNSCKTLR